MGLYCKVFGGMVRIGCIYLYVSRRFGALWFHMMVVVKGPFWVAILAHRIASIVVMVYMWSLLRYLVAFVCHGQKTSYACIA